ncbi:hypothetical protein FRC20_001784, partial [Serendipita sp. 405]
ELRGAIRRAIPPIIHKLEDEDLYRRLSVLKILSQLAKHVDLHDAIRSAILLIADMLENGDATLRLAAVRTLAQLSD